MASQDWQVCDRILELRSKWLTLISEQWQTDQGQRLEYWRVEKADSVIVLPLLNQQLILASPMYRPGVHTQTLDFPGGRLAEGQSPKDAAMVILQRELGIDAHDLRSITPVNHQGWAINSSFSNQYLYGVVAELHPQTQLDPEYVGATYDVSRAGLQSLLDVLLCLQCRAIHLEWSLYQPI
ncbi:NUDIX domain-containing protein [Acaryochloris marina]|uniref:Hydrolase, NUDIX family, putative n=1 Tax=Acaryochloris marina (strain MBIC 11017) TaxID=329726 RepID=B0CB34_ACAM1|nr:NUDIX domain-containing protein [Acaryochloris marina]ABW25524.1 hydrolase, NUDIX family, putative [Acaryochloris marina MBIC11017]BDM80406.1 NUDIX hydrolase [Acaryochloris marina MBIC10699]